MFVRLAGLADSPARAGAFTGIDYNRVNGRKQTLKPSLHSPERVDRPERVHRNACIRTFFMVFRIKPPPSRRLDSVRGPHLRHVPGTLGSGEVVRYALYMYH